jgi:hypothetical protein
MVFKSMAPGTKPAPRWCLAGLTKTQRRRVQKLRARELEERSREEERGKGSVVQSEWPMVATGKTLKQKRIQQQEQNDCSGSDAKSGKGEGAETADINMVFHLPIEFALPETAVAQLNLGARGQCLKYPKSLAGI